MKAVTIGVLLLTLFSFCVSEITKRPSSCEGGELVHTNFGEGFNNDQKWAIRHGLRDTPVADDTPVSYFNKTKAGKRTQWILKLETDPTTYGRLGNNRRGWYFHDIDGDFYKKYFEWCRVETPSE